MNRPLLYTLGVIAFLCCTSYLLDQRNDGPAVETADKAGQPNKTSQPRLVTMNPASSPEVHVSLRNFQWKSGGFGVVMLISFTLVNGNAAAIRDPRIECQLAGDSGTAIGTASQVLYKSVKPRSSSYVPELNMGLIHQQATRASCKVMTAEWDGPPPSEIQANITCLKIVSWDVKSNRLTVSAENTCDQPFNEVFAQLEIWDHSDQKMADDALKLGGPIGPKAKAKFSRDVSSLGGVKLTGLGAR